MAYYTIKIIITVILVVGVSELSKRNTLTGSILASVPLISVLAMSWLYYETKDVQQVSDLAKSIFWLVLPSLVLFVAFPILIKLNYDFVTALFVSIVLTIISYFLMLVVLKQFEMLPE